MNYLRTVQRFLKEQLSKISRYNYKPLVRAMLTLVIWGSVVGAIGLFLFLIYLRSTLPDPESIATRQVKESTKIYDQTGETVLYDIYKEEKRTIVAWEQIDQDIKNATIAIEDSNFYNHKGLEIKGIMRALWRDISNANLGEGGSTITQQLVKLAIVGGEKTPARKLRELMLAIEVERRFKKDEILWMYLNQIPYGSNAYGVESGAQTYFGKHASDVTLGEAAVLAALPQAPSFYSPYGSHTEELFNRQKLVLRRMLELGHITKEEYQSALTEKIAFVPKRTSITAPHFVIMVKDYLVKKYGQEMVESGGFKVTTTLDAKLQDAAQELVDKYGKINREKYSANNTALVSINPKDGGVLALVGSTDYFDTANDGNFNIATALRQPGSAFKPFAYAALFAKGYPDSTVMYDVTTEFNPNCSPDGLQRKDKYGLACYNPQNFDGKLRGLLTLRQALGASLNIVSVKTLYLAGIKDTIDLATKMGITSLTDPDRYGLSLVLGGAEVKLIDLVSGYGVFANDGIRNPWKLIKRIELADGTVLEENKETPTRVLEPQVARMINDVLADNVARTPTFGVSSSLVIPGREMAAKTGTTQESRDGWALGYTPSVVTGVWAGNSNNKPILNRGAGISASGPLMNAFMRKALEGTSVETFIKPNPVSGSKTLLNGNHLNEMGEAHSELYYINKNDPLGPAPVNPFDEPQFKNWEWAVQNTFPNTLVPSPTPPTP
jgi:membrane peptidoglycan carboxypeptidase